MLEFALIGTIVLMAVAIVGLALTRRQGSQETSELTQRLDSLNRELGQVTNQTQRILEVGQDMREVLAVPKLRGGLGEQLLENLLRQVLPKGSFQVQYTFRSGRRVDAVIRLEGGIVPIDAKFPLEDFRRLIENPQDRLAHQRRFQNTLRGHVDAISENYIVSGETLDFALMYIPSESIYYELLLKDEGQEGVLDYAWTKKVILCSPNSLYAYLQIIALGLRGLHIEQNARAVLDTLTRLQGDFDKFAEDYRLIGTHLNRAQTKYNEALPKIESLQRALPGQRSAANALEAPEEK